ncbi:hypothetical protein [Leptospira interrogans]|nr:hypothetical protein [Leptospira interrogans]MBO8002116.1 hypothetical protein [Leptospira interrogans serovar Copenhageni]MBO8047388.1 hypothetical protein [Leptospira interrogans serovar Copenhageni]MBW9226269.1 hypothetical protein [Leptospira interrogans]MDC2814400.1 hypothetical protein [Leptospira interrogans]MTY93924.1 hypothetical protein [Leptospira interrogans serovar Copenhageni]
MKLNFTVVRKTRQTGLVEIQRLISMGARSNSANTFLRVGFGQALN